jgi:hypothetical protein
MRRLNCSSFFHYNSRIFYFPIFNSVAKKKTIPRKKKYWGGGVFARLSRLQNYAYTTIVMSKLSPVLFFVFTKSTLCPLFL